MYSAIPRNAIDMNINVHVRQIHVQYILNPLFNSCICVINIIFIYAIHAIYLHLRYN